MKNEKYYVYVYLDPRKKNCYEFNSYKFDYEPFYVGKGCGDRYLKHLIELSATTSNIHKFRKIRKILKEGLEPIIIKVVENISESKAYEIETLLINTMGRLCDSSGFLTNIVTDGKPPKNYIELDLSTITNIIGLYNNGECLKHIGQKFNLGERKIYRTLLENGITPKRHAPTNKIIVTDEEMKEMIKDYEIGLSIRSLSLKYKLSFEGVRRRLKEHNVILRGYDYPKTKEHIMKIHQNKKKIFKEEHSQYKKLTNEEITLLKKLRFEEKKTIHEIVKIMKISQKKFYEYINL